MGGKSQAILALDQRTGRAMVRQSGVDNEQLTQKLVGRFRQRINEPAAQGKTGNALEVSGLASRCARRVGGMIECSVVESQLRNTSHMISQLAVASVFAALSAALLPLHFAIADRSPVHVLLVLAAAVIVIGTYCLGRREGRKHRAIGMEWIRFFAPSVIALGAWIVHSGCTPLVCVFR